MYSELAKESEKLSSPDTLHGILANTEVTVENVYVRFEETELKFALGLLIPKIQGLNCDDTWTEIAQVIHHAILYKKLTIKDVSLFVNYGSNFTTVDDILDLHTLNKGKEVKLDKEETRQLRFKVNHFVQQAFKDSEHRFAILKVGGKTANQYIYQEKAFSIDSELQITLNHQLAKEQHQGIWNQPDIKLKLKFGGLFKRKRKKTKDARDKWMEEGKESFVVVTDSNADDSDQTERRDKSRTDTTLREDGAEDEADLIAMSLDENQVQALLHFGTFMTCFNNFSQGVLQQKFFSSNSKTFWQDERQEYIDEYKHIQELKTTGKKDEANTRLDLLFTLTEEHYRTDVLLMLRDIAKEEYYETKKIEKAYQESLKGIAGGLFNMLAGSSLQKKGGKNQKEQERQELEMDKQKATRHLQEVLDAKLEKVAKMMEDQFGKNHVETTNAKRDFDMEADQPEDNLGAASWYEVSVLIPKTVVKFFLIPDPGARSSEKEKAMSVVSIDGLQMLYITKSIPAITDLTVKLEKITVEDPQIKEIVYKLNPGMRRDKRIVEQVLETVFQEEEIIDGFSAINEEPEDDGSDDAYYSARSEELEDGAEDKQGPGRKAYLATFNMFVGEQQHKGLQTNGPQDMDDGAAGDDHPQAEGEGTPAAPAQPQTRSEIHTDIELQVLGRIIIYSNFSWLTKIFLLVGRMSEDMQTKKQYLVDSLDKPVKNFENQAGDGKFVSYNLDEEEKRKHDDEEKRKIRLNIISGFQFVQRLSKYADEQWDAVKRERLIDDDTVTESPFRFTMTALSPKLIVDEYLLAEKVLDPAKPAYFLVDMGRWTASNCVIRNLIEAIPTSKALILESKSDPSKEIPSLETTKQVGIYETFEMKFEDLKIIYSQEGIEGLLDQENLAHETFTLFDKFNFGFQYLSLVDKSPATVTPETIINLMFQKLLINYDRTIFCQLLKVYGFFNHGSWNRALDSMIAQVRKGNNMFANYDVDRDSPLRMQRPEDVAGEGQNGERKFGPVAGVETHSKARRGAAPSRQVRVNVGGRPAERAQAEEVSNSDSFITANEDQLEDGPAAAELLRPAQPVIKVRFSLAAHGKSVKFAEDRSVGASGTPLLPHGDEQAALTASSFGSSEDGSDEASGGTGKKGTGLRVNLAFSEFKVTAQTVKWHRKKDPYSFRDNPADRFGVQQLRERLRSAVPTRRLARADSADRAQPVLLQKVLSHPADQHVTPLKPRRSSARPPEPHRPPRHKLYDKAVDFEVGADQLKIQTDIPDGGNSWELFVMLERIQARDLRDDSNMFPDLIEARKTTRAKQPSALWQKTQDTLFSRSITTLKRSLAKQAGRAQRTASVQPQAGSRPHRRLSAGGAGLPGGALTAMRAHSAHSGAPAATRRVSSVAPRPMGRGPAAAGLPKQASRASLLLPFADCGGQNASRASSRLFARYGFADVEGGVTGIGFDFTVFDEFYPREEYYNDKNQFAFRYSASEKENSKGRRGGGSGRYDVEEARIKTIKMKKIKIIANFALVERMMAFSFNSVHDYENVDREYRAHVEVRQARLARQEAYIHGLSSSESGDMTARNPAGKGVVPQGSASNVSEDRDFFYPSGMHSHANINGMSAVKGLNPVQKTSQDNTLVGNFTSGQVRRQSTMNSLKEFVMPTEVPLERRGTVARLVGQLSRRTFSRLGNSRFAPSENVNTSAQHIAPIEELPLDENRATARTEPAQHADARPRRKVHQKTQMHLKFQEISLCIPTNLQERRCLALKIKVGVEYLDTYEVDDIRIYRQLGPGEDAETAFTEANREGDALNQETHQKMQFDLRQLKMYMTGHSGNQAASGACGARSSFRAAANPQRQQPTHLFMARAASDSAKAKNTKDHAHKQAHIIHPVDFAYVSKYADYQHDKLDELIEKGNRLDDIQSAGGRGHGSTKYFTMAAAEDAPDRHSVRSVDDFARELENEEVKEGHEGVLLVGRLDTEMTFAQPLKVQLKIKEIRAYQSILQLTLHYKNRLVALEARQLAGWDAAQAAQESLRAERGEQAMPAPGLGGEARRVVGVSSVDGDEGDRQIMPTLAPTRSIDVSLMSLSRKGKSASDIGTEIRQVNPNLLEVSGAGAGEDSRQASDDSAEKPGEFGSSQSSADLSGEEEEAQAKAKDFELPSLAELVKTHSKRQEDGARRAVTVVDRQHTGKKKGRDELSRKVFYSHLKVSTEGFTVAFDDDLTEYYDGSLISLGATKFGYDDKRLYSGVLNAFRADSQFNVDRDTATKVLGLPRDLQFSKRVMDITFEAMYFNHKSFFKEYLLEPYEFQCLIEQDRPLGENIQTFKSKQILNLNLTYGCIISLYQALQEVKDAEESMARAEESMAKAVQLASQAPTGRRLVPASARLASVRDVDAIIREETRESGEASDVFSRSDAASCREGESALYSELASEEADPPGEAPGLQSPSPAQPGASKARAGSILRGAAASRPSAPPDGRGSEQLQLLTGSDDGRERAASARLQAVMPPLPLSRLDSLAGGDGGDLMSDGGALYAQVVAAYIAQGKQREEALEAEHRERIMPKVNIINDTGKPIVFWLANEKDLSRRAFDGPEQGIVKEQRFELGCGPDDNKLTHDETGQHGGLARGEPGASGLTKVIKQLLHSFKNEELNRAQLYLNIQVDEQYHMLNNINLFQMGLFAYKLRRVKRAGGERSQHCLLRMVREGNQTTVHFESIAVIFNNCADDLVLEPFCPTEKPRKIIDRNVCLKLPKGEVTVLPLTWFEGGYQVLLSIDRKDDDQPDENEKGTQAALRPPDDDLDGERYLFKNGNIREVLNPNITEPYCDHARQIKLGEKWTGLEFAMLGTRTKYGQFVLSISTLTEVLNLMMTKMQILPAPRGTHARTAVAPMAKSTLAQDGDNAHGGASRRAQRADQKGKGYAFETNDGGRIPELNLEQIEKQDCEFEVRFWAAERSVYTGKVTHVDLKKMASSELLGFNEGVIVEMMREEDKAEEAKHARPGPLNHSLWADSSQLPNHSHPAAAAAPGQPPAFTGQSSLFGPGGSQQRKLSQIQILPDEPEQINCVLEKQLGPGCLVYTEYNNFSLRQKVFHHRCCYAYEFYVPLVVVNQTAHRINIFDKRTGPRGKEQGYLRDYSLAPKANAYVNLTAKSFAKQKIRIQIPGHEPSASIDLKQSGTHGILAMQELELDGKKGLESGNKIEVATSITQAGEPYVKTKVLRIVPRFVLVNRLTIPIVVQEPTQRLDQVCLPPRASMDYNFLQMNKQSKLRMRMLSNDEHQQNSFGKRRGSGPGTSGRSLTKNAERATYQDGHWSHYFPTENIGDFQISLPQLDLQDQFDGKKQEGEISTSREQNYTSWAEDSRESKAKQPRKRGWNVTPEKVYVRVTITNDQLDQGKLFILVSTPHLPEYLIMNYLPYEVKIQQKIRKEHKMTSRDEEFIMLDKGKRGRNLEPTGTPFILNPMLARSKDTILITLQLEHLPPGASVEEKERHRQLQRELTDRTKSFALSKYTATFTIRREKDFVANMLGGGANRLAVGSGVRTEKKRRYPFEENFPFSFVCKIRKSGSTRIIEIYEKGQTGLPDEIGALSHDDQMDNMLKQVTSLAFPLNPESEEEHKKQVSEKFKCDRSLTVIKLQGIGISLVDFQPSEVSYISFEGLVILQEYCQFQLGTLQNSFTKKEISLRNFQLDASQNELFPVVLGPKTPFRNIERGFRREKGLAQLPDAQPFLDIWFNMSEETVGDISTKSIEDININVADLELSVSLGFVSQIQDLLQSLQALAKDQEILADSQIMENNQILKELLTNEVTEERVKQLGLDQQGEGDAIQARFKALRGIALRKQKTRAGILSEGNGSAVNNALAMSRFKRKEEACPMIRPAGGDSDNEKMLEYNKAFVEDIIIDQINIQVTFRLRGIEKVLQKRGPLGFVMNIGSNFADISDSEFIFSELRISGLQESIENLQGRFYNHYKKEAIRQFYQLLGSQDILGNPSSFIKNLGRGTVELQNAPFDNIISGDPHETALTGVARGVKSLLANTTLALSSSYASMSGSIYLGMKNAANAGITHQDLDQPLSIGGGLKKGTLGFGAELYEGVVGLYKVPRARVRAQGLGPGQLAKGVGQGALQFATAPLNAPLRATYDLSTGIKNTIAGKRFHKQRFRYPRHFDRNERMPEYQATWAQALTAMRVAKKGKYKEEVCNYALDLTHLDKQQKYWHNRVIIITNESVLLFEGVKHLRQRIPLRDIRGMMIYFYDKTDRTRNSVHLELVDSKVVRVTTNDPDKNEELMDELQKQLKQLQEQYKQKKSQEQEAREEQKQYLNTGGRRVTRSPQPMSVTTPSARGPPLDENHDQIITIVEDGYEFSFEIGEDEDSDDIDKE